MAVPPLPKSALHLAMDGTAVLTVLRSVVACSSDELP